MRGYAVLLLGLTACGPTTPSTTTDPAPVTGKAFYQARCGGCHPAFPAHAYSDQEWPGVVRRMSAEAHLTQEEERQLVLWLTANNGGS